MKIAIFLYLTDILSRISYSLTFITVTGGVLILFMAIIFVVLSAGQNYDNDLYKVFIKYGKKVLISWLCLSLLWAVIPRKEFMYIAGGLYLGNEALQNPKIKTLIERSYKILDDKLNAMLKGIEGVEK